MRQHVRERHAVVALPTEHVAQVLATRGVGVGLVRQLVLVVVDGGVRGGDLGRREDARDVQAAAGSSGSAQACAESRRMQQ